MASPPAISPKYKPPFPWFGGKAKVAPEVWRRFGEVRNYCEPFAGSLAMLMLRPTPFVGTETINDLDGFISNFWRAVKADPEAVAHWADWPVNENDLHARHVWLRERRDTLTRRLEGDPDYFDPKVAGWWVWGQCCWIGSGWCDEGRQGPWGVVVDDAGHRQLVHLGDAGRGVNRQLVHLGDAGRGVNRQLVHLGDAGQGVNRQRVHLCSAGQGVNRQRAHLGNAGQDGAGKGSTANGSGGLVEYFAGLCDRLRRVRICCGDWTRVCGGRTGNALRHFFASGPTCGIFLDPPYANTADRTDRLYSKDSLSVAHDVRRWAIEHGDDPRLRICLAGYQGEHEMPSNWKVYQWKAHGGYGNQGKGRGAKNCSRETLWFSPHCLD